jgi:hypothetical protein
MNRLTAEESAELADRIHSRAWGWKAAFNAWYLVHGEAVGFVVDRDGRHLEREPGRFIKTNLSNLSALGLADVVQDDDTLRIDPEGVYRYRPLGDLEHGFTAYERIT